MILPLHDRLRTQIQTVLRDQYGLSDDALPSVAIQYPPNRPLGDLAVTVAFELARTLRKAPRLIAQEIVEALGTPAGIRHAEATPNGYINLYLDRAGYLRQALRGESGPSPVSTQKTIVEHTAINPNKAAHVGHLRNSALGDTLVRLLTFQGHDVETQNYIDDTGVQVADVVVGFRHLESKTLDDIRQIADGSRFDYYCWDLYAKVTEWYEADKTRLQLRAQTLRELEDGNNETAEVARFIAHRIVARHLATMDRLNVEYDLLTWEGDILRLDFWAKAFAVLKATGAVVLQDTGTQAGCWILPLEEDPKDEGSESTADDPDQHQRSKVIVRSDGTVTYIGKDIAYQLWKFGLLDRDFDYYWYGGQRSGRPLWTTSAPEVPADDAPPERPRFGQAAAVYNVIDTRQAYLQDLLKHALRGIDHPAEAERSIHFSYEMVALSPATAKALGYHVDDEGGRPFVEVSGRKGLGVKADDLLDRMTDAAKSEVRTRNPEMTGEETDRVATMIATAAVRYFMIKYSRGKVIAFDIDEALSFEGESGPYLQYAAVRAANILEKLRTREALSESDVVAAVTDLPTAALDDPDGTDLWALVLEASRLDEVVEQAVRTLELSVLAKYAFGLAQAFNAFYHRYPVISEGQPEVRLWRAAAVIYFKTQLARALALMGCETPSRM